MIWIPCNKANPDRDGMYLVTTAKGAVRFDRYVDGVWGLCNPKSRKRYKEQHIALARLPRPAELDENGRVK